MPLRIKVEDSTYQEKLITLNSNSIFITISFNTRDSRWYFDLVDRNGLDLLSGVKILAPQNLTSKYIDTNSILGGNLYCVNTKGNGEDITRDNFGTDKQFQLWYYTTEEEEEIFG